MRAPQVGVCVVTAVGWPRGGSAGGVAARVAAPVGRQRGWPGTAKRPPSSALTAERRRAPGWSGSEAGALPALGGGGSVHRERDAQHLTVIGLVPAVRTRGQRHHVQVGLHEVTTDEVLETGDALIGGLLEESRLAGELIVLDLVGVHDLCVVLLAAVDGRDLLDALLAGILLHLGHVDALTLLGGRCGSAARSQRQGQAQRTHRDGGKACSTRHFSSLRFIGFRAHAVRAAGSLGLRPPAAATCGDGENSPMQRRPPCYPGRDIRPNAIAAISADTGTVSNHTPAIERATPQRTADSRCAEPTPASAEVMVYVVEIGAVKTYAAV